MMRVCGWLDFNGVSDARKATVARAIDAVDAPATGEFHAIAGASGHADSAVHETVHVTVVGPAARRGDGAATIARAYADERERALRRLTGAYAGIIVDERERTAFVATDRFGSIPVYFRLTARGLAFSTRLGVLRTLLGDAVETDPQALFNYVFFHCIPSPRTIYRDIAKLAPAEILTVGGKPRIETAWQPRFATTALAPEDVDGACERVRSALLGATRDAARDGVIGAFLSGGLDSSTVAGMLKEATGSARTFTVGFDEPEYDESAFARITAAHFGTTQNEIILRPEHVGDALHRITEFLDEPFGNSSVLPTYFCARLARDTGVDTLLAGDGGDELFAGNTRYVDQAVFERYERVPRVLRYLLEAGYAIAPVLRRLPLSRKGYGYISKAKMGLPDRLQAYNFLNQFDAAAVFDPAFLARVDIEEPWRQWRERYAAVETGTPLQRMLYLDWKFTLADNDLVKVTSMCELAGVEVRYPMLDERVVDAAIDIDSDTLLLNGELRGFYKYALRDFLPSRVISKTKHGFGLPFGVWMRRDPALKRLVADALDAMKTRNLFRTEFIDTALDMHNTDSPGYYGELVWIMMVLELWLAAHE